MAANRRGFILLALGLIGCAVTLLWMIETTISWPKADAFVWSILVIVWAAEILAPPRWKRLAKWSAIVLTAWGAIISLVFVWSLP